MEEKSNKRQMREYSAEFQAEAVKLVKMEGRGCKEVARSLGIPSSTIRGWCQRSTIGFEGVGVAEKDLARENRRLEAEVTRLKMEQEILKKAAAYFAKNLM